MATEITLLAWTSLLFLAHLLLQASASTAELGLGYGMGARDEERKAQGTLPRRAARAFANLRETFPIFGALALALAASGRTGGVGALGAQLYFWGRVIYLPLYLFGVPIVRSLAWGVSLVGLLLMAYRLPVG